MNILVTHNISDPAAFWGTLSSNPPTPEGFKVLMLLAGADHTTAACLWKAPDVDSLRSLVEQTLKSSSHNTYMVVDESRSMGL
jgi:hypothetical protein